MATKYLANTFNYGLLIQTNWATPQLPGANFKTVPYNAGSVTFEPDVKVGMHNTSGQSGIQKEYERLYVDSRSGLSKVSFSMPADVKTLAPHLFGAILGGNENAGTPFLKTITAGGLTGTIDFNGDDVKLHTIAMDNKASADDGIVLENAIIDTLNMSWDFNANGVGRLMQIDGTWVGNEMNFAQTTDGTWTTTTFTPMFDTAAYTFSTLEYNLIDWSSQNVRRFTFSVNNNVTTNASTTAGKPNNYDVAPVYTSKIIMDYNATTEKILGGYQSGNLLQLTLDNNVNADGDFVLTGANGVLQKQPFIYNGEFAGIELDVIWHSASAATPVTISFIDTIDWGY